MRRENSAIEVVASETVDDVNESTMARKDEVELGDHRLLAACLVSDARDGLRSDYKTDSKSLKLYILYRHWTLNYALYILVVVLHGLAFFEQIGRRRQDIDSESIMLSTTVELLCLFYFVSRMTMSQMILPATRFWHDAKNIVVMATIFVTLADILLYFSLPAAMAIRWTPVLRPLFIVNFAENRQIRRAIRNIRNTLPDILNVLILFSLSVATFSLIGLKLFQEKKLRMFDSATNINSTYFENFPDIFFHLYVLVTTSNNPDITMPAYNKSRSYALYFVLFLIVNLYLFMNIVLAVVYNNYRKHLKKEVKELVETKHESLSRAFELQAQHDGLEAKMSEETFMNLMSIVMSSPTSAQVSSESNTSIISVLWSLLEENGKVSRSSFLKLVELLNMNIQMMPLYNQSTSVFEQLVPFIYNCKPSRIFRSAVKSKYFRYLFDALILVNAILIAIGADRANTEWLLLLAFSFEILAKLYTFSFRDLIRKFWNVFDMIVIGAAVCLFLVVEFKSTEGNKPEKYLEYLELLLILRILRLWKVIADIDRFSVVVKTIIALLPSILTYGGLLFVVFYAYAIVGMQLYRDKIPTDETCDTSSIHCCPSSANGLQYCKINFDTIETSLLYLFDLMVVNQWHVMAKNVEIVVGSKWTRLYFVSFHLICVIAVLNIFTAFVLEAFILEFTNVTEGSSSRMNELEQKIKLLGLSSMSALRPSEGDDEEDQVDLVDADHDTIDGIQVQGRKNRSTSIVSVSARHSRRIVLKEKKSVEALLLRMFEGELT
ncbi:Two pore calcium channel protein 1B [Halotydeus destructor]|nr:Two pore calcium channel protein 1B [Halotydeus destructor]